MGAMVWELEGPGPILKSSVMAVFMGDGIIFSKGMVLSGTA